MFDQLTQHGPVPELLCLSLVSTSAHLSSDWLSKVEAKCPKLSLVYFTRRPGDKALGWSDVVMMQSMREPALMPCGHVGDATSLRQIRTHLCPMCRTPYSDETLVLFRSMKFFRFSFATEKIFFFFFSSRSLCAPQLHN